MAQIQVPRERRVQVVMKAETTSGTDVLGGSYTASDIVPAQNIRMSPQISEIVNLATSGALGRLPSAIGVVTGTVSFDQVLRGAGAAYSASVKPEAHLPLLACGFAATLDATGGAESYSYQPSNESTVTIYIVVEVPGGNSIAFPLLGSVGTFSDRLVAGQGCLTSFRLQGALGTWVDLTYQEGSLGATPTPPVLKSAALQLGSGNYAPRWANLGFDLGADIRPVESANASGAMAGYFINDRNPRLTFDPEADRVANFDWYGSMVAGTRHDLTFQVGTAQYNRRKYRFNASAAAGVQVVDMQPAARGGIQALTVTLLATLSSAANDEMKIVYD